MSDTYETPKVAVIGCGQWGGNHVRSLAQLGALAAVADANGELAAATAVKYGVAALTVDAAITAPDIAAVVIASPAATHAALARAALLAGKHVLVEKPMALDTGDAADLARLAESRGRCLMVGHLLHYHPAFQRLREIIGAGELGTIRHIRSTRFSLGRVRSEEDVLWSFAPHDVSMVLAVLGREPETVRASGAAFIQPGIADVAGIELTFADGAAASIQVSWAQPVKEQKFVVVGDRGMAVFDDTAPWERKLTLYPHAVIHGASGVTTRKADPVPVPVAADEPLLCELRHFLECARSGRRPRTDAAEGLRVLSVLTRATFGGAPPGEKTGTAAPATADDVHVHESAYVDDGVEIGAGTRVWHFSHLLSGTRIGARCVIGQNVVIGPHVTVGDRCKIQNNVSLYKGVTLEDGVFCGPSCVFTNVNNPRAEIERKSEFRPTLVRRGATIGANATIVCGSTLGEYSFIAAGAVVTRDVPAHAMMAGVPARRIGWMSRAGVRLPPDLVCPQDGSRYRDNGQGGLEIIEE